MNQTNKIQATKSLAVFPGDNIDLEVWEYHEGNSGFGTTSTPINTLITNVAGAFGGISGAPDVSGSIYNGVNLAVTNIGTGGNQGSTRPAAYINYILFDKNYKVMNAGWQLAPATTFTKQKLSFTTINVKEAGFIFVWLSYDDDSFHKDARIYGPRTFAEYRLWKGFSPRVEAEVMNTFVPPYIRTSPADLGNREWVWGVFVGMKKDYKFLKKINGTALVMLRLFDPQRKSPYADVINARFGFALPAVARQSERRREFPMKKNEK